MGFLCSKCYDWVDVAFSILMLSTCTTGLEAEFQSCVSEQAWVPGGAARISHFGVELATRRDHFNNLQLYEA